VNHAAIAIVYRSDSMPTNGKRIRLTTLASCAG
jgi:hypothetical protein